MRCLVVYANPKPSGLCAALHHAALNALDGHEIDNLDLYAEQLNPIKTANEVIAPDGKMLPGPSAAALPEVAPYVERLVKAEAIVLVYPVWHFGFPAILKGFFDRVLLPDVCFHLEKGRMRGNLDRLRLVAAIATYGAPRLGAWWYGDPTRRFVLSQLAPMATRKARTLYLPAYRAPHMNQQTAARFIDHTTHTLRRAIRTCA